MSLTITIPGEPVAQGRPRAFRTKAGHLRTYDPTKSRNWKAEARAVMVAAKPDPAAILFPDGPCTVDVLAVFTCPKSAYRKHPVPRQPHAKRPDADNVTKAVLDAGKGVLWRDDTQVARLVVEKWVGAQGEAPFVRVEVR